MWRIINDKNIQYFQSHSNINGHWWIKKPTFMRQSYLSLERKKWSSADRELCIENVSLHLDILNAHLISFTPFNSFLCCNKVQSFATRPFLLLLANLISNSTCSVPFACVCFWMCIRLSNMRWKTCDNPQNKHSNRKSCMLNDHDIDHRFNPHYRCLAA